MQVAGFAIYEKITGTILTVEPLTVPIGETIQQFQAAGYDVGWTWTLLDSEVVA